MIYLSWAAFVAAVVGLYLFVRYLPWIIAFCVFSGTRVGDKAMSKFAIGVSLVSAYAFLRAAGYLKI
jgi:hypothetical protein